MVDDSLQVGSLLSPLKIPEILELIFKFCTFKDLNACRLVSKFWRSTTLKQWRAFAKVSVHNDWVGDERKRWGTAKSEFLNYVQQQKSEYLQTCFVNNYFWRMSYDLEFWKLSGDFIKILELAQIEFGSLDDFKQVVYQGCPNLQQLTLEDVTIPGHEYVKDPVEWVEPLFGEKENLKSLKIVRLTAWPLGVSWLELLSHFSSLEAIDLGHIDNVEGFFRAVNMIRKRDVEKLKFRSISLRIFNDKPVPPLVLELLLDRQLSLKNMDLDLPQLHKLPDFLNTHASTLKQLRLSWASRLHLSDNVLFPNFPLPSQQSMQSLEEIILIGKIFGSMRFLKLTPNLKEITAGDFGIEMIKNTSSTDMVGVNLDKFTKLILDDKESSHPDPCQFCSHHLERAVTWFPNLQHLEVFMLHWKNEQFEMICKSLPGLKWLEFWGTVNDCGLTGWDAEDVQRINREGRHSCWLPTTVPRANVTSLKHLRHLRITASTDSGVVTPRLGFCAAKYGIKKIPNLTKLKVEGYHLQAFWRRLMSQYPMPINKELMETE